MEYVDGPSLSMDVVLHEGQLLAAAPMDYSETRQPECYEVAASMPSGMRR
jgi:hypothetical protein